MLLVTHQIPSILINVSLKEPSTMSREHLAGLRTIGDQPVVGALLEARVAVRVGRGLGPPGGGDDPVRGHPGDMARACPMADAGRAAFHIALHLCGGRRAEVTRRGDQWSCRQPSSARAWARVASAGAWSGSQEYS